MKLATYALPFFLALLCLVLVAPVQAALVPCGGPGQASCTFDDLKVLLVGVYNFLLGGVGLVALLFIVISGLRMFLLPLSDDELSSAKSTLKYAIIGIIIVACAYLIVNTMIFLLGGGGLQPLFNNTLDIPGIF